MRIDSIRLKNYRCFADLPVELHPQMTVLVAPNGQGKTTVLDAIKVALWPFVAGFDMGSTTNDITGIHIDDVRLVPVRPHEMDWRTPSEIKAEGFIDLQQLIREAVLEPCPETWPEADRLRPWDSVRSREKVKKGSKTKDGLGLRVFNERDAENGFKLVNTWSTGLHKFAQRLQNRIFQGQLAQPDSLPMLGYYGTGRLWSQKKLTATHESSGPESQSRTFAYRDCLDPASSFKHFSTWFKRVFLSLREAQIQKLEKSLSPDEAGLPPGLVAPVRAVQSAVNAILQPHTGWHTLEFSIQYEELVLNHDSLGKLKVSQLSDGIRNMLALVGDIAYRCYKLNAHLGEDAARLTQGIVMIDEVDMHLHPEWQQTVLTDLMAAFPRLQFIVTTHSPQVLSTIRRENIRVLRATDTGHEAVVPDFSPLAHESGDALSRIMGTHRQPPLALLDTVRAYEQLVRAGQESSDEACQLKADLDEAGYQIHGSELETWRFLARHQARAQG